MNGSSTAARRRFRPSASPNSTPATAPKRKPRTVSVSVTSRLIQRSPVTIQSASCFQMSDGLEIQNALISRPLANCQKDSPATTINKRQPTICRYAIAGCGNLGDAASSATLIMAGVVSASDISIHHDVIAHARLQIGPEPIVQLAEMGVEA